MLNTLMAWKWSFADDVTIDSAEVDDGGSGHHFGSSSVPMSWCAVVIYSLIKPCNIIITMNIPTSYNQTLPDWPMPYGHYHDYPDLYNQTPLLQSLSSHNQFETYPTKDIAFKPILTFRLHLNTTSKFASSKWNCTASDEIRPPELANGLWTFLKFQLDHGAHPCSFCET